MMKNSIKKKWNYDELSAVRKTNMELHLFESRNNMPICLSRPQRLRFDISSACNINCVFCLAAGGRKARSAPDAFRKPEWFEPLEPMFPFLNEAVFSSYEAILNPWFDQYVNKIKEYHIPFSLFSNGKGITPELGEFMLRNGLFKLNCSFHAAHEDTYHDIMRGSNYDTVVSNLIALKVMARKFRPDFELTMTFCAMERNIHELPQYVDLAKRCGAHTIVVNYLSIYKEGLPFETEAMIFHQDLYDYNVLTAKKKALALGINLRHHPTFCDYSPTKRDGACYLPWTRFGVRHDGAVNICCGGAGLVGNAFEDGFDRVWNGKLLQHIRRTVNSKKPMKMCRTCTRGREHPFDIRQHLRYLKKASDEQIATKLEELGARLGKPVETLHHDTMGSKGCQTCY